MSPSAARNAANQEKQSAKAAAAAAATEPPARCSPQLVPNAVKAPKSPSNLAVINRFTAAIATEKPAPPDSKVKLRIASGRIIRFWRGSYNSVVSKYPDLKLNPGNYYYAFSTNTADRVILRRSPSEAGNNSVT
jgi:hypothetical protein